MLTEYNRICNEENYDDMKDSIDELCEYFRVGEYVYKRVSERSLKDVLPTQLPYLRKKL